MSLSHANLVKISKFLSLVLRHQPDRIGVRLDEGGWIDVATLLDAFARHDILITRAHLDEVVRDNDKQRFTFSDDGRRIRANQGHSVDVDLGYDPATPPETLFHGTSQTNVASILARGIEKGQRHHVHLSPDEATALRVGRRHGAPVALRVRAGAMHRDGRAFYLSKNGVWLTDHVPPAYIEAPASGSASEAVSPV